MGDWWAKIAKGIKGSERWVYPAILTIVVLVLFKANYVPGTWLSGWDSLHPEFDFGLYWQRILNGAWQEHQGVGAPASQSHAAEIPRVMVLWVMSWFLPASMLRYAFFFGCLLLGVWGMYGFGLHLLESRIKSREVWRKAAFVGALFYICNIVVVQHMYVPLEMFVVHWASLPWLVWAMNAYISKPTAKKLLAVTVVSVLLAPMAHTATLFYAMGLGLLAMLGTRVIISGFELRVMRSVIVALLVLVVVNAYWLLPNLYFVVNHSQDVVESQISANFSDEAFLQGKAFGNGFDLLIMRNFLFNWREFDFTEEKFVELLDEWREHYVNQPGVYGVVIAVWLVAIGGVAMAGVKKDWVAVSLLPVVLVGMFFWINENPPFGFVFSILRDNFSVFKEGVRFPFTKFSILLLFGLSGLMTYGLAGIISRLGQVERWVVVGVLSVGIVGSFWPAFEGYLISPTMKVEIPREYFEMFEWFEGQENNVRVAKLPLQSYWGWNYYDWGYQGAGFSWFGIPQPTFDREFDRWSPFNESFYKELSQVVYGGDVEGLERVMEKYRVGYLLLDESVVNAGGNQNVLLLPQIREILADSGQVELAAEFDFLKVYETGFGGDGVWAPELLAKVDTDFVYSEVDVAYQDNGEYVGSGDGMVYPFGNFDRREGIEYGWEADKLVITRRFANPVAASSVGLADFVAEEKFLPLNAYVSRDGVNLNVRLEIKAPVLRFNGEQLRHGRRTWQTVTLESGARGLGFLAVGDKAFDLRARQIGDEEVLLGSVVVDKESLVEVGLYSLDVASNDQIVEAILDRSPRLCGNPEKKFELKTQRQGQFSLEVGDESVCLGERFTIDSEALMAVSFEVVSKEGLYPWFCITAVSGGDCINDVLPSSFSRNSGDRDFSFFLPIKPNEYWFDFVAQSNEGLRGSISFENLEIESYEEIAKTQIDIEADFGLVSREEVLEVNGPIESIEAIVDGDGLVREDFSLGRGNFQATNCELDKAGSVGKQLTVLGNLVYTASNNGVSCDFFDYAKLPYAQSYLVNVVGENRSGRGLKVYLSNQETNKIELEEVLPQGKFDEAYMLIGQSIDGSGYTLNLETRSFLSIPAENVVERISFWPVAAEWLGKVRVEPEGSGEMIDNLVKVIDAKRLNQTAYEVRLETSGERVMALDQGWNKGWVAYGFVDEPKAWGKKMPFLGGLKLEQVKVNSWQNGWRVSDEEGYVVVWYWPQVMVWMGLWAVGLIIGGELVYIMSKTKKNQDEDSK